MNVILRTARSVMSILSPLMGERSSGWVLVRATGAPATLPKNSYAVPVVGGQVHFDALIKSLPESTIDPAGTLVPAASVLAGAITNLAPGTPLRWDPPIDGIEAVSEVAPAGFTGGMSARGYGAVRQVKLYEQIGSATAATDLFAAKVGHFPALVLSWDQSAHPTDIVTRKSRVSIQFREHWLLSIVASRHDGSDQRRHEALEVLEAATQLLADRSEMDGEIISLPCPLRVESRRRIAVAPTSYVYAVAFNTMHTLERREWRTIADWLRTRLTTTTKTGDDPEDVVVRDNDVLMR
jgi:hypothetical protein